MKQTGMVGVARVLRVHLPVVRQHFNEAADDLDFAAAKDPVEPSQNLWSNEVFDGRRLVGERAEHEAVERCHTQLSWTVIRALRTPSQDRCGTAQPFTLKSGGIPPLPFTPRWTRRGTAKSRTGTDFRRPGLELPHSRLALL